MSEDLPDQGTADRVPVAVRSPMQGVVVAAAQNGDLVATGRQVVVLESMKMEHVVPAPCAGHVRGLRVALGELVAAGDLLCTLDPGGVEQQPAAPQQASQAERAELRELRERKALLQDEARTAAVERRHAAGRRTVREDLADLLDDGSWVEYGGLAVAAQRARRSPEELRTRTPADGLVAGLGRVNGDLFADDRAQCAVLAYDYTVLAGTQGTVGHLKTDRFLEVVERLRVPVVLFAEGGGGRPGDTDYPVVSGLHTTSFSLWAGLSGLVPRIGIVSGRCFAGNAALLGCSDVVIATRSATVGMGGPAMIEGGGLGTYTPEEVGPVEVQAANGVLDVVVDDDAAAVATARQVLGYFQGPLPGGECADQTGLRTVLPAERARAYDVRDVLSLLADRGSVTELRAAFARGMVTALARLDGRAVGVLANDPRHLAGAITSDGADKAARFLQLCDAFDLPVVTLVDTPGMMVGPEAERTGLVRHTSRLFVTGASLTVPVVTVVLRKAYGLGAQAMALGSTRAPLLTVGWPTAELGAMGVEGAVKLALRSELAALQEPERQQLLDAVVADQYDRGRALSVAAAFEIDDVIDPADTRETVLAVLRSAGQPSPRTGRKRVIDPW